MNRILRFAYLLTKTILKSVYIDDQAVVFSVRPYKRAQRLCPICGLKSTYYDTMPKARRWRTLDFGQSMCFLEYQLSRVHCPKHGIHVESVPWARYNSRFTKPFEDKVAWMAVHCTISAVAEECRIEWHSVGGICARVYADLKASVGPGRFEGLRRIGIDECSYKKNRKYLIVIVDHDRSCLVWAGNGYGKETLNRFLDEM
ncbi:MAG: transposase family protein [Coriobacteriales bacterium]|jgi:transposase|nr:transposase family protein [Coriobacteriales bacterium]